MYQRIKEYRNTKQTYTVEHTNSAAMLQLASLIFIIQQILIYNNTKYMG